MEFSEWITQKYVQWRGSSIGKQATISEFATYVGVGQSLVSQWMKPNGKKPTSAKALNGLHKLFGDEVYEILGITKPASGQGVSVPTARDLRNLETEITEALRVRGLTAEMPEAEILITEILTMRGWTIRTSITKPEE